MRRPVVYLADKGVIKKKNIIIKAFLPVFVIGLSVFGLFLVSNAKAATATVNNESELNTALADSNNDTININSDFSTSNEVVIDHPVTINGNGHTLSPTFSNSGDDNSAIEVFNTSNVTVNDLKVDGSGGNSLHGINIYVSTNVLLDHVTSLNNDRSGIVVNGSTVTVNYVTTGGNGWHGINVDQGGGVSTPAVLTVNGISIQTDTAHIYVDDTTKSVTINDTKGQYTSTHLGLWPHDLLYTLNPTRFEYTQGNNQKINICHAKAEAAGGYTTNPVSVNGLNGHDDHANDIIPPNSYLTAGLNWSQTNAAIWENECSIPGDEGEVIGDQCEVGPGWAYSVEDSDQGLRKDGSSVLPARSDPDSILGTNDGTFYSLGFGGKIVVKFNGYVTDVAGDDITLYEVTNGPYPEEVASVEVSQDGTNWVSAGSVTNNGGTGGADGVDIFGTGLAWIKFVRITDNSNSALFATDADGYDLDAVKAANIVCDEPQPEPETPTATLAASKIICDKESSLPNLGNGGPNITSASFASDWVAQNPGCHLADNWDFQYQLANGGSEPTGYGELGGNWTTFTNNKDVELNGSTTIQVREVLPEGYIPFSGGASQDDYSAEFYCNTDVLHYDNWEWITSPQDGATYYCVAWNVLEPVTVQAAKIVCVNESYLPNWGDGASNNAPAAIDADTADNFLASVNPQQGPQNCQKVDWDFQWNTASAGDPEDNTGSISGWNTFSGSDTVWLGGLDSNNLRFREVWDDQYIGFTGQNTDQDVSAEIYCGTDILHYDNWEWVDNVQPGDTINCVAWNVLKPATLSATKIECVNESYLPNWGDGTHGPITATTADEFLADVNSQQVEPVCHKIPWQFQWATPAAGDPEDNTGALGGEWTTFDDTATVWLDESGNSLRMREVWDDQYIPFTGQNTDQDVSAEIYCADDVLHYDNWEWIDNVQPGDTVYCVAWNTSTVLNGRISGLVYNDANNDTIKQSDENVLADHTVWLLTHNSPYKIHAITTTDSGGSYLFEDLAVPGTYYVCQDVEDGWLQTQLNNAGAGGIDASSLVVGDEIPGDDAVIQGLVDDFCYAVNLTIANPTSELNDFGNFQDPEGQVRGISTTKDPDEGGQGGSVLGASTLANTGNNIWLTVVVGGLMLTSTVALYACSRVSARKK